ncbi:MAG TPA: thioredoxin domain-containing protein [Acidimicrobiales bacterium]|nr:thioredoxin domain-containing protein [Acidimicrobiales bacterium]
MPRLRDRPELVSSSYLRQHLTNPVDWFSWGDDALARARDLDRPIFLSIGYAACHWCHVMAHESFESEELARVLNEHFVAIKVDREERPDLDALYMAATQLVSGHGGWPMSVFLTPDGRPFMAGTYYPPTDRGNHVGFDRLLAAMSDAWQHQRERVERQADELAHALTREVRFLDHLAPVSELLNPAASRRRLRDELVTRYDPRGGFGPAPKFPRPSYVEALFDFDDAEAQRTVEGTLEAMARHGLFDHLVGGFARYSVDDDWHVPHFEKMLCDQALLARCYLRASNRYRRADWRLVALATLDFVETHMRLAQGYASSLDADAGGHEGSHVTWTPDEVASALAAADLGHLSDACVRRWRLDETDFEGRAIPRLRDGEPFACPPELSEARDVLVARRRQREQPGRDEKVILEWNAMLASALLLSGDRDRQQRAYELLGELGRTHFEGSQVWRTEARTAAATASDLAWYIDACVDAFEASGDDAWLDHGADVAELLTTHYWEGPLPTAHTPHVGGGVSLVDHRVHDLAGRPQEVFDGATHAAHSVSTRALARLALCRGDQNLLAVAERLVELARTLIIQHPGAVPDLVAGAGYALEGIEVVIPGDANPLSDHVRSRAMIRTVLITGSGSSPLLAARRSGFAYVCRGGVCSMPVDNVLDLQGQLDLLAS